MKIGVVLAVFCCFVLDIAPGKVTIMSDSYVAIQRVSAWAFLGLIGTLVS